MSSVIHLKVGAAIVCALGASAVANATVTTVPDSALVDSLGAYTANGYYTNSLGSIVVMTGGGNANGAGAADGRNDDGFSGPINLGFTESFEGQNYTQIWVNNNGNVSFGNGISSFTPDGPQGAPQPIISPFFADVDTRNAASGVVMINQSIPNELIVTWNNVGYYSDHATNAAGAPQTDSFQLVLRGPDYSVPTSEGTIGFFYGNMQWETGDASGGSNGFGGTPAAVGFGDGAGNGEILAGSIMDGISGIVDDHYIWFNQNLTVVPPPPGVPEPGSLSLMGLGLAAIGFALRKRAKLALRLG